MVLAALPVKAQEAREPQGAVMTFETMIHKFGDIPYRGEPRTAKFVFTNTGDSPLIILRAELSCSCLSADFPKRPVAPGETGVIEVTYTPKKDTGKFENTARIITNATVKRHTLFLEGNVTK